MRCKFIIILFVMFGCINSTYADDDLVSKINSIKNCNDDYLYAESTSADWEEALNNAIYLLKMEVEIWAKDARFDSIDGYFAKYNNKMVEIKTMRGNLYRAFVYLKKSDLIAYTHTDGLVVIPSKISESATVREVIPSLIQDLNNQGCRTSQDSLTELEKRMLDVTDATKIRDFIMDYKGKGIVNEYGRRQTIANCAECYVFIFNNEHKIAAYLHKVEDVFYNLQTGSQDDIDRYSGCGALWFNLK